jgi:hypothetical protein
MAALERRVVLVASHMTPQGVSNAVYGFAALGRAVQVESLSKPC